MATAALLGFELAPRIRDIHDQTLYKLDHSQHYPYLTRSSPVQLKRTG
jgi:TnpA family transposase